MLFNREIFFPSTAEGLNICLGCISEISDRNLLKVEEIFSLHTIVVEAVENAIIHGNKGCQDLPVRVLISISELTILVEIEDSGEGFDIDTIPSPVFSGNLTKESGRGIFFMKCLSSSCITLGRGNIIRIIIDR